MLTSGEPVWYWLSIFVMGCGVTISTGLWVAGGALKHTLLSARERRWTTRPIYLTSLLAIVLQMAILPNVRDGTDTLLVGTVIVVVNLVIVDLLVRLRAELLRRERR